MKTDAEIMLCHVIENIHATADPLYFAIPKSEAYESELMKMSNKNLDHIRNKIINRGV